MLPTLVAKLNCPTCQDQAAELKLVVFRDGELGHVGDGVVQCLLCGAWCPIQDDLLELVPAALLDQPSLARFQARYGAELASLGLQPPATTLGDAGALFAEQLKQRQHFDLYAHREDQDYLDYAKMPFWIITDRWTFERWRPAVRPRSWLLDVGCANGRSSFWPPRGCTVVGFDISRAMISQAIGRARHYGCADRYTFFVGDGSRLALKEGSMDYVQTYGVLHHLPDPQRSVREIQRVLKPGGIHFGSENNVTFFRGLFDLIMRRRPIWVEEAGPQALISHTMLGQWLQGLPTSLRYKTIVIVPPHLLNLLGVRAGQLIFRATNAVLGIVPGLRDNGGLIVFEIEKSEQVEVAIGSATAPFE